MYRPVHLGGLRMPWELARAVGRNAGREEMRRFLHSTIAPVARIVAGEMADKLDTPGLSFDFSALFASDL